MGPKRRIICASGLFLRTHYPFPTPNPEPDLMRFIRRTLTGIFLMSLTFALLAYAGSIVFGAVQAA